MGVLMGVLYTLRGIGDDLDDDCEGCDGEGAANEVPGEDDGRMRAVDEGGKEDNDWTSAMILGDSAGDYRRAANEVK